MEGIRDGRKGPQVGQVNGGSKLAINTGVMGTGVLERQGSSATGLHRQRVRTDFFHQGYVDKVRLTWDNGSMRNSTSKYIKTGREKGRVWEEVGVKYLQRLGRQL